MIFFYYLKLYFLPFFIIVFNKIGFSWEKLGVYFKNETILAQLSILFKRDFLLHKKTDKPLNIVFLSYLGHFLGNNIIQITIAQILRMRGHRIRFVLCDKELPICESTDISNHSLRKKITLKQRIHLKYLFKPTGFEIIWLSQLISNEEIEDLKTVNTDKWDTYVNSMLLRYFKVGILDFNNHLTKDLFNRAKHAALISERLGNSLVQLNPDRVVFSHGTYTTRGPAKDVLNSNNIPIFSISRAKMAESQKFNWKTSGDWWDIQDEWILKKNIPLNEYQEKIIDDYLDSRRSHNRDIIAYNFSVEEDNDITIKKLNLDPNKKIYTLFTNVLWDAASAQREIVFENSISWILETIQWFKKNIDKQLIIRIHPAENIIGTNQPIYDLITQNIELIPNNVTIIKPDAYINSWSLLKITDYGLVHTSTVGMELALEGKPCICVARTHYRGKGFTIDVSNKDEYFNILQNTELKNFDNEYIKILSKRYAYILFIRYQIPLPFYYPKSHIGLNSFKILDWSYIFDNPGLKTVVNCIENKTDFLLSDEDVMNIYLPK